MIFHDSYYYALDMWALILFYVGITVLFFSQGYFYNDDMFNFNYAQAKAALGNYKEAEEVPYFSKHLQNCFYTFVTDVIDYCICTYFNVYFRFSCCFRVKRSRMTMFTSAGWHDAVCIVVVKMTAYLIAKIIICSGA